MPTPRIRTLVSLAAALTVTLTLGGCAGGPARAAAHAATPLEDSAILHFDNGGRDVVHVYLVGQKREWLLGRVEPGARATLRIPEDALAENPGSMRLAVLPGQGTSLRAARDSRASLTLAQPAAEILSQRWTFSQATASGELTSLRLGALVRR